MTDQQRLFANEYLIDLNATRAYKAAYPKVKKDSVAAAAAVRVMKKPGVAKYIEEQLAAMASEKIADAKEVVEYLTSVMRGEITEEVIVVEGVGDGCSSARRMDKGIGAKDRIKAAELLGKRYSLFTDKLQVDGNLVQISDNIPRGEGDD